MFQCPAAGSAVLNCFRGAPDELVSWASAALFIAYEICIRKPISAKRKLSRELANFGILRTRSVTLVTYSLTYIRSGLQNTKAYVLVCRAISRRNVYQAELAVGFVCVCVYHL